MAIRMGSGKQRQSFRIYEWLDSNGIGVNSIAMSIGITPSMVSSTIRGRKNNRRILQKLVEMGCPKDILSLPDDLDSKIAA